MIVNYLVVYIYNEIEYYDDADDADDEEDEDADK